MKNGTKKSRKNNIVQNIISSLIIIGIITIIVLITNDYEYQSNLIENSYLNSVESLNYDEGIFESINNNIPAFSQDELDLSSDYYSQLDEYGRPRNVYYKNRLA